jgi:hypothetical protein
VTIDPVVGPETEFFFEQAWTQLQRQTSPGPMALFALCDLNSDGVCDARDWQLLNGSVDACVGTVGYVSRVDVDGNGCITREEVTAVRASFEKWGTSQLVQLELAKVWIGLKNSDDQGTNVDVRAEVLKNGVVIASGEGRCITGVTRNPDKAKEVSVEFSSIVNSDVSPNDVLALRVLTRIGTKPDGTRCAGHASATGLRLYYDASNRPARFGAAISPDASKSFFLHGGSGQVLNALAPLGVNARTKDSAAISGNNGNPWKEIGIWRMTLP